LGAGACGGGDPKNDSPWAGKVVINEIDSHGRDWVELYNTTDADIPLGGWILSDKPEDPDHLYVIPSDATLKAGAHWVVKQADEDAKPADREGFTFGLKAGDTVYLLDPDGKQVAAAGVGSPPDGSTWGRLPNGTGAFQETSATQAFANHPPTAVFLDPLTVNAVDITVSDTDYGYLGTYDPLDPDTQDYVHASVTVTTAQGAFTLPTDNALLKPAGVRLKSGNSFRGIDEKASFKVRATQLLSFGRFFGLKGFTLNSMVDDPTLMRETLGYRIFREAGIPALRSGYARVSVNGADYGLYVVLERYDDEFVEEHFDTWAHVYEGSADLDASNLEAGLIEMDEGDPPDTDIDALIEVLDQTPTNEYWVGTVGAYLDLDRFTTLWAVENYIGHFDGYAQAGNNYYLHSTPLGSFTMMPWGLDRAFVQSPAFPSGDSIVCTRCLAVDACASRYGDALEGVASTVSGLGLDALITEIAAVIGPEVATDPRMEHTAAEQAQAVTALRSYLTARAAAVP
jgi:hypothetical protein